MSRKKCNSESEKTNIDLSLKIDSIDQVVFSLTTIAPSHHGHVEMSTSKWFTNDNDVHSNNRAKSSLAWDFPRKAVHDD